MLSPVGANAPRERIVKNDVSIFAADEKHLPRSQNDAAQIGVMPGVPANENIPSVGSYNSASVTGSGEERSPFTTANNQYRPVLKKHGLVSPPFVVQFANFRKGVGRRVVDFRCFAQGRRIAAANDENAPILQHCRRVGPASDRQPVPEFKLARFRIYCRDHAGSTECKNLSI